MTRPDPRDGKITIVASMSGGKDSTAMSLHLREQGIEHRRVFADTGWEHPATVEYVLETLQRSLGPIDVVSNDLDFEGLCLKKGMFPSRLSRFCTEMLKVKPILLYIEGVGSPEEVVNTVGVRAAESRARAKLSEWEFNDSMGIWTWRPLFEWSVEEVVAIHKRHDVPPNPLYTWGAERVGCWPCIFARKSEIRLIALRDPGRIDKIRDLELRVTELARKRYEARGETFESLGYHPPTFFHPKTGDGYMMPIDEVVDWASTSYGGRHRELFFDPVTDGCARWGLCDTTFSTWCDIQRR